MAAGPCGYEFREAFSCFHYSTADPKGSDCLNEFRTMQECMAKHPGLYDSGKDGDDLPSMDIEEPESSEATETKQDDATETKQDDATETKQDDASGVSEATDPSPNETETKN
jgi:mitochondrial intermembrane space import and assembly protein 40